MNKNILIVDDSESIRLVVSMGLKEAGYNVVAGVNGSDGLRLLNENKVDLIISDLNMPVMDGITFLKEVRKQEKYKFLPLLILTTESQESKKLEAKQAGATGWIIKPFVKEKLIAVVKKVLV
ncbi:MAG: response regulator [Cryomorphaceae bacterium]|jgi:two-component system chemotaxis response regulator CheY|nr:response regulator [Cryomorphaceae bacterium]